MKEDFELQQVSLRTSRKHSLCLSAFVGKNWPRRHKDTKEAFPKGLFGFYSSRRSSKKQLFMCCTEFDGPAGPEDFVVQLPKRSEPRMTRIITKYHSCPP